MITAAAGDYRVFGGPGADRIRTGDGADEVDGGRGDDAIATGAGADSVNVHDGRRDRVRCGPGRDTVKADQLDLLTGCELVNQNPRPRMRKDGSSRSAGR